MAGLLTFPVQVPSRLIDIYINLATVALLPEHSR
jgi:hypothetical protein